MNRSIIILSNEQFGYNPATYYYCKYLKDSFRIVFICWDHKLPRLNMDGIHVEYIVRQYGIVRVFKYIKRVIQLVPTENSLILIKNFMLINTLVRIILHNNPVILDIRTGSINPNKNKRCIEDLILKIESLFFKNVTIISKGLSYKLGLNEKAVLAPLGAETIASNIKKYNHISLLYIGTLNNRHIEKTIEGFAKFYFSNKHQYPIKYSIIGEGLKNETKILTKMVKNYALENVVHILGRIPHDKLKPYFENHNIGVSYIPLTDYYDIQPPTKTFEYLLSGMPVIATATSENKIVINNTNGILIRDTADDFCKGLLQIHARLNTYNSEQIRNTSKQYEWRYVVNNLKAYIQNLPEFN